MRVGERLRAGGAWRSDRGSVTVEASVVLPVLVVFSMALVWALFVVAAQIQCVDAARTGARAAARQDPDGAVVELTRAAAPRGAEVTLSREGDRVRVVVVARPWVLGRFAFDVREEAVASVEGAVASTEGTVASTEGTVASVEGAAGPKGAASGTVEAGP